MLSSDDWRARLPPGPKRSVWPDSTQVAMGARAIGTLTVHQEYTCETCQEFTVFFTLLGDYDGHPHIVGDLHGGSVWKLRARHTR